MYRKNLASETSFNINDSTEGEFLETKIERIVNNGEPIDEGAPLIYTERSEGVDAGMNPRTDKWEIAIEAMGAVTKTHVTKREARIIKMNENKAEKDVGDEPIHGNNE